MTTKTVAAHEQLFEAAWEAGRRAAEAVNPNPMVVTDGRTGQSWYVGEGACGFAWVNFPGNTSFGRWASKTGRARRNYRRGLDVWIGAYGQSYERKRAHAQAMAEHLREHGVKAYADSRLD